MTDRLRRCTIAAILFGSAFGSAAEAESVRVISGPNSVGGGWMFLDSGGCHVVTAAHVVAGSDGRPLKVVIRDGRGIEWVPTAPIVFSSSADIAVLPIPNAADPAVCGAPGRSRLGVAGVAERARTMVAARIERFGFSQTEPIPIELAATRTDLRRGEVFGVKPTAASVNVEKGWSGSPITDAQGMIGIVVDVDPDTGIATAVRADAIADLLARARHDVEIVRPPTTPVGAKSTSPTRLPTPGSAGVEQLDIRVGSGETVDPAQGPTEIFSATGAGWTVRPKAGTVAFDLLARNERTFERVSLAVGAAGRVADIEVAVEVAGGGRDEKTFLPIRTCKAAATVVDLSCAFLAQTRRTMRISLRVSGTEPLSLKALDIR